MHTKRKTNQPAIPNKKSQKDIKTNRRPVAYYIGLALVALALIAAVLIFYPAIKSEAGYLINRPDPNVNVVLNDYSAEPAETKNKYIVAKDKDFSIVIPKIGANAKVVENVDPTNSKEYQIALTKGVSHAGGTSFPDQPGNTFIFAHSTDTFYNANYYNAVFYLLNKMQKDDLFYIVYKEQIYKYRTVKTAIVESFETSYYAGVSSDKQTATLMTCWPPATTLKRLVVIGELQPTPQ
jgi:sortase A